MRLLDLERSIALKRKVDRSISLYFSVLVSVILFVITLLSGQAQAAFIVLIVTFIVLFGLVFGILYLQTSSVIRKLRKIEVEGTYLEVSLFNEQGILVLNPDKIVYHGLIVGANEKKIELEVNEDLFISYGEITGKKRHKYKYGGYQRCHITVRPMPHGRVYQFRFFDTDDLLEKVGALLESINQFNVEKYQ